MKRITFLGFMGLGLSAFIASSACSSDSGGSKSNLDAGSDDGGPSGGSSGRTDGGAGGANSGGSNGSGGASTGGASAGGSSGGDASAGGSDAGTGAGGTSGDGGPGAGGSDASSSSGGGSGDAGSVSCADQADAGTECNALANIGADLTATLASGSVPTGTGGTVVDGRYALTEFFYYAGSPLAGSGLSLGQTLLICGTEGQLVSNQSDKGLVRKSFSLSFNGTVPTATTTCTTDATAADVTYSSYTATPTTITFHSSTLQFSVTYTMR